MSFSGCYLPRSTQASSWEVAAENDFPKDEK
jgi:hypothetical protein